MIADEADLADLYSFDPVSLVWTDLTPQSVGHVPTPREFHGLVHAPAVGGTVGSAGVLLVFGGNDKNG